MVFQAIRGKISNEFSSIVNSCLTSSLELKIKVRDNVRKTFNSSGEAGVVLFASNNSAEYTGNSNTDFLSNGFKCRTDAGGTNGSGQTHIYLAFAETPFKYANAR